MEDTTGFKYTDTCRITGGEHIYFLGKTIDSFEPLQSIDMDDYEDMTLENIDAVNSFLNDQVVYVRKEYGILACKCGSAIKQKIERV